MKKQETPAPRSETFYPDEARIKYWSSMASRGFIPVFARVSEGRLAYRFMHKQAAISRGLRVYQVEIGGFGFDVGEFA
jgi:hypothetical protein